MFRLCLFLRGKDQPIRSRNIRGSCEATPGKTKDPSRSKMSLGDETEKLFWDIRPPTRSDERLANSKIPRCLTAGRRAHRDDTGFVLLPYPTPGPCHAERSEASRHRITQTFAYGIKPSELSECSGHVRL